MRDLLLPCCRYNKSSMIFPFHFKIHIIQDEQVNVFVNCPSSSLLKLVSKTVLHIAEVARRVGEALKPEE